jgi:hypothetical protein
MSNEYNNNDRKLLDELRSILTEWNNDVSKSQQHLQQQIDMLKQQLAQQEQLIASLRPKSDQPTAGKNKSTSSNKNQKNPDQPTTGKNKSTSSNKNQTKPNQQSKQLHGGQPQNASNENSNSPGESEMFANKKLEFAFNDSKYKSNNLEEWSSEKKLWVVLLDIFLRCPDDKITKFKEQKSTLQLEVKRYGITDDHWNRHINNLKKLFDANQSTTQVNFLGPIFNNGEYLSYIQSQGKYKQNGLIEDISSTQ